MPAPTACDANLMLNLCIRCGLLNAHAVTLPLHSDEVRYVALTTGLNSPSPSLPFEGVGVCDLSECTPYWVLQ